MANTSISNAFISLNDIINNFIISYTGPGKLIPDLKRTEVIFHARRCLQEFAYETLKSQFTVEVSTSFGQFALPSDFVAIISVVIDGTTYTESAVNPPSNNEYYVDYTANKIYFNQTGVGSQDLVLTYLSNALTTDESAAIPKLAEEALYSCIVYAILANRENTNPNTLQRLLIEKIDKLEKSKSRLIFANFSS